MTATITTVQTALKTALEAIAGDSPPVAFGVRVADNDVAGLQAEGDNADVVIGFEASGVLGETDATILEQMLIPITVRRRNTKSDQTLRNQFHDLTEVLRDAMRNYRTSTTRVDQILSPHPFDLPQATSPAQDVCRFVLDMDVLRRMSEITDDATTPERTFTKLRKAVWDALNHWEPFQSEGTWGRTFETDEDLDELALHDPGKFDLPAIAVTWGPTAPEFFTHTQEKWPTTINVVCWYPAHEVAKAEYRLREIVRAIWQSKAEDDALTYIRRATGLLPKKDGPLTIEPAELGRSQQLKVIKTTASFVIPQIVDPQFGSDA